MGNILRQGLAAYQQTMSGDSKTKEPEPAPPKKVDTKKPATGNPTGLLKTSSIPHEQVAHQEESKTRRVAKFLILIGSDQAAKILGQLDSEQVEAISQEIASIRSISHEEAETVFAEFKSLFSQPYMYTEFSSGGIEAARRILYAAYGPEKGEALLNKTVPDSKEKIFDFLEEFNPEQLVFLLKDESPATTALILARLPPKITAETLVQFPPQLKPEILKKIAYQNEVSPDVLDRVAGAVRERVRHMSAAGHLSDAGSRDIAINGMQTLAAILKQGDYALGDRIISELETEDPDIGKDLKEKLYTLDDVLAVFDRPLAEKLKTMPDKDIAILLKGRSSEFREKILSNISAGRRGIIREEGEMLGAVPRRDCDAAASDFIAWFRQARENGSLILSTDEDWVT